MTMPAVVESFWPGIWLTGALVCAVLLFYTFVGYPVLVTLIARYRHKPLNGQPGWQPRVAVVIVMHNEAARVRSKLATLLDQDYPCDHVRIVVVSDGSTDGTVRCVQEFAAENPTMAVTIVDKTERRGKAACLNDAVATGDEPVVVFTDARQMLNLQAVSALVDTLSDPAVAVVSGELEFRREGMQSFGDGVDAYWRYEKMIRKAEARLHSVPGATGALYAMRRAAFRPIDPHTILDDVAIPMQACLLGGRVVFDPRALAYDDAAQAPAQERARKVRTLAGNFQLLALMPQLCVPWRNPIFWQYLSHKVLRLLAPWAMLGLLLFSLLLAPSHPVAQVVFGLQLLFYVTALGALQFNVLSRWKPLRVAAAFVALNAFAVLGLWAWLMQQDLHRWKRAQPAGTRST
jgi:biofilm PGA synthesis N-glycosyltransferase PgaC